MTTQTVNFLIAIFGISVAGISVLIYRDSKGRVAGSAHWIAANLCFVLSLVSFLFPHVKAVLFLGALFTYSAYWIAVEGFLRYYRTGTRIQWLFWMPFSVFIAFFEASLADTDPRMRYLLFNGYFALMLLWGLQWSLRNIRTLGIRKVLQIVWLPSISVLLGTFRFAQGLLGRFDGYWFYGGDGETLYRLTLFVLLGAASLFELRMVNHRLASIIEETNREHARAQRGILVSIASLADNSATETPGHVARVGRLSEALALALGWDEKRAAELNEAAQLHDLGKIAIPDGILEKTDALSAKEQKIMKSHTHQGAEILSFSSLPLYRLAARIAAEHHENWDGSGYPARLKHTAIAKESRIVAICDVVDALSRQRSYKNPWTQDKIRGYLLAERGKKFDPDFVDAAIRIELWEL
ncbi:MAG: HD domain-containing protein [Spirochaetales bacterium]|nr:HD domain-containing protein [Spirochaetales bacterium]